MFVLRSLAELLLEDHIMVEEEAETKSVVLASDMGAITVKVEADFLGTVHQKEDRKDLFVLSKSSL